MSDNSIIGQKLFVSESAQYGDAYIEHLLEQYKIYINSIEKVSDRRQNANEFFLAVNSALVTLLAAISANLFGSNLDIITIISPMAGIAMAYLWFRMILSYKGLNTGKFTVVHEIEKRLPLALYDSEWEALGRGIDKKRYWPFTHIELIVPWVFISLYIILFIYGVLVVMDIDINFVF